MKKQREKKADLRSAGGRIARYLHAKLGIMILALVLAVLSAAMTIIGPGKIGKIATIMSDGLLGGIDLGAIAKIGLFLAVCSR